MFKTNAALFIHTTRQCKT